MNEVLAERLRGGFRMEGPCFGDLSIFAYEKVCEILNHRLLGTDEKSAVVFSCTDGLLVDGSSVGDLCIESYERYAWSGEDNLFERLYHKTPEYIGGKMEPVEFYSCELVNIYDGDSEKIETLLEDGPTVRRICALDEGFYKAIPRLEDMFRESLMEQTCGDAERYWAYAISSPQAGAFLEWAEAVEQGRALISKEDQEKLVELKRLFSYISDPMDSNYVHTGIHDHVWYSVTFVGDMEIGYGPPSGTWELTPDYLPVLDYYARGVDDLNARYGFFREEVKYEAQHEAA